MRLTAAQLADFHAQGFLVLPALFSRAEVEVLRAEVPALFAEDTPANIREKVSGEVRTAMGLHLRSDVYARLCRHPRFVEPARQILGTDQLYIQQAKINAKVAFSGEAWQWHYDFATHHAEDGVPEPLALNLHVFLDDVTEHNGPLVFIRGSHLGGPVRTALDTETTSYALWTVDNETVARLARAGGLADGHGRGGHRADLRRLPRPRVAAQHVALGPLHLLGHPQSDRQRPDALRAAGLQAPPRFHARWLRSTTTAC